MWSTDVVFRERGGWLGRGGEGCEGVERVLGLWVWDGLGWELGWAVFVLLDKGVLRLVLRGGWLLCTLCIATGGWCDFIYDMLL